MAQQHHSTFVDELKLKVLRAILWAGLVLIPLWGWLTPLMVPGVQESLLIRSIISITTIVVVGLSYKYKFFQKTLAHWFTLIGSICLIYYLYFFAINDLHYTYSIGISAIILAISFAPIPFWNLILFLSVALIASLAVFVYGGEKSILISLSLSTLYIVAIIGSLYQKKLFRTIESERVKADILGRAAAQAAHDIKAPLGALNIVRQVPDVNPEKANQLISRAVDETARIAETLLNAHRRTMVPTEIYGDRALKELLVQLAEQFEGRIASEGSITFEVDVDSVKFVNVSDGFALGLSRSLNNLLNNAKEAIEVEGRILLSAQKTRKGFAVSVVDTGKGMATETVKKATQFGFTLGKSRGSGLGLYQVSEFCQMYSGHLEVKSEKSGGTEVNISF